MIWSFRGDIQARIELFERELMRYERRASDTISLNQRTSVLLLWQILHTRDLVTLCSRVTRPNGTTFSFS